MSDFAGLIKELLAVVRNDGDVICRPTGKEELAAAALSSQAAEIERLREALKPFADYCDELNGFLDNHNQPLPDDDGPGWVYVKVGDFRRARAALTPKPNKEG